jgi:hypothetical protein
MPQRQIPVELMQCRIWSGFEGKMRVQVSEEERQALEAEMHRLNIEHRDLDAAIAALEQLGSFDQLQIQRLKKRKLFLRDRAAAISDRLTPDIIA